MYKIITLIIIALVISGCNELGKRVKNVGEKESSSTIAVNQKAAAVLGGGKFRTTAANGTPIYIEFDNTENRFYGRVVNRYIGAYTTDGNSLNMNISQIASTMMMGLPDAMEAETEYFKFLPTVKQFTISGNSLIFISANGEKMTFERE